MTTTNIQPGELMIGNYLKASLTNEVIQVDWLVMKHVSDGNIQAAGYDNSTVYEPIPLTEQWLLEFGAKKNYDGILWLSVSNIKAELHFEVFDNTDEIVTTLKSSFCELILDRIRYVHQLQVLHFALTATPLSREK